MRDFDRSLNNSCLVAKTCPKPQHLGRWRNTADAEEGDSLASTPGTRLTSLITCIYTHFMDDEQLRQATADVRQSCLSMAVRQAARTLTQRYDAALSRNGIRSTQFSLLVALAQAPSLPLSRLARAVVMDRTTLTRNLAPLVRRGLVGESGAKDKRVRSYALTARGKQLLTRALPDWKSAQTRMLRVLAKGDAEQLRRLLRTVVTAAQED
jgi:DNA-binding MarR family transcriptional regulator